MADFDLYPIGENAITIQFDTAISQQNLNQVLALDRAIQQTPFQGFIETVPAYASVTVYFDVLACMRASDNRSTPLEYISTYVKSLTLSWDEAQTGNNVISIPVCYHSEFALDLPELAEKLSLEPTEIMERHISKVYTVFLVGFTPGFPYMGPLDESLRCSRKASPRKKVPAGSVAMAGNQTGIYPFETPGGWQIIGRTPLKLFDANSNPPARFQAGMKVRFETITKSEFNKLQA